jgi:hypothetical protein
MYQAFRLNNYVKNQIVGGPSRFITEIETASKLEASIDEHSEEMIVERKKPPKGLYHKTGICLGATHSSSGLHR